MVSASYAESERDSFIHSFFLCSYNSEARSNIIEYGRVLIPQLNMDGVLFLQLGRKSIIRKRIGSSVPHCYWLEVYMGD